MDEDIINEDYDEVPQVGIEYCIHQYLECGTSIHEAKRNEKKLIVSIMCVGIRFRDIIHMNSNLVIPRTKIQLGEKMSTMKLINNRNCELILNRDEIKCSKFNLDVP